MSKRSGKERMTNTERKLYTVKARVFKALGNSSRLIIIDALRDDPKNVNELAKLIGASLATTSRHLAVLRDAGLVSEGERRGNMVFYSLDVSCIPGFMSCVAEVMKKKRREWG